jgi:hypothetical protein
VFRFILPASMLDEGASQGTLAAVPLGGAASLIAGDHRM